MVCFLVSRLIAIVSFANQPFFHRYFSNTMTTQRKRIGFSVARGVLFTRVQKITRLKRVKAGKRRLEHFQREILV